MEKRVFISYSSKDKPIADAICHDLEERGIRCWIAPRDILTSDWAGSIMKGLHGCEVFVVVISHNSIESPEVTKEVTEATRTCTYLLPFKVDAEMLSDRLQYHLGPCHWLDAVNPPLEKRIAELADRIENLSAEDALYVNHSRLKLVEKVVYPQGLFVGREHEMAEIDRAFSEDHIVFLQGMGGIGKSEIAKGYAREYRADYDTVIFATYVSGLQDLICGSDVMIENLNRAAAEDAGLWFRRKLEALRSLATERTLLIIDNFDVDEDPCMAEVFSLPCRILVTTRNNHPDYPVTIEVGPIEDTESLRRIFAGNLGRSLKASETAAVDEILRLVGSHTITVELIAKQMMASFLTPEQMLGRLRSTGVDTHLKEKVKKTGSTATESSYGYIRRLFSFSDLTDSQKHLLAVMTFVPVSGVQVPMLGEMLELEDYDDINTLIGKSWLVRDAEAPVVRMHPVIRDVVRSELSVTPASCPDYMQGLQQKSIRMWSFDYEERIAFYSLVKQVVIDWPDPTEQTLPVYVELINAVWQGSEFERAQTFGRNVYEYALKTCGETAGETGRAALNVAGAYHNAGDDIHAEDWYRKAYESMKERGGPVTTTLAMACFKIGRCAVKRDDLAAAQPYYDEALRMYEDMIVRGVHSPNMVYPEQYTDLTHDLARLARKKGDYAEAMRLEQKCCEQSMENIGRETVAFGYYYLGMAICCSETGDFAKADEYFEKTMNLFMEHLGVANLQTMDAREAIADSLALRGDSEGAQKMLATMELDLEKYFGKDNPLTVRIREKAEQGSGTRSRF